MEVSDPMNGLGRLTPEALLEASRPKGTPLHDRFDWDDETVAGAARRHRQAQDLIQAVGVVARALLSAESVPPGLLSEQERLARRG